MQLEEIATKADLEAMEKRIAEMIKNINAEPKGAMSLEDACKYLGGIAPQTLRQKCSRGEIACRKAGGLKFRKSDLDEYLDLTRRKTRLEIEAKAALL